jgi:competence protein ComEC
MGNNRIAAFFVALFLLALIVIGSKNFSEEETKHPTLRYWLFDVGQGDAMLLETPGKQQILIDGGPDATITRELSRVMPLGDRELDLVILTHNHSDHLSGIIEVLRRYRIKELWITGVIHTTDGYRNFLELAREKNIPTKTVRAGQTVVFGELSGVVLWPIEPKIGQIPENQNWESIVTYWQYGKQSLLLTGDMEKEQELELLRRGALRPVTILKVAHQGSQTSSSEDFIKTVRPKLALISVGRNPYGHPHPAVLHRYAKYNIPILRTDQRGTIQVDLTTDDFSYQTER